MKKSSYAQGIGAVAIGLFALVITMTSTSLWACKHVCLKSYDCSKHKCGSHGLKAIACGTMDPDRCVCECDNH